MGCDVHAAIEYVDGRFPEDSEHHYSCAALDVDLPRWYSLFGFMNGVRGDGPCVDMENKGIPDNASWKVRDWIVKNSDHSESWLELKDFENAYKMACQESNSKNAYIEHLISFMRLLPKSRIVFGFDS